MTAFAFVIIAFILLYIFVYWQSAGKGVYNAIVEAVGVAYEKYAPYSYKQIREKIKQLGQEYTVKQYTNIYKSLYFNFRQLTGVVNSRGHTQV